MSIEWINPPRDWRDEAEDAARELLARPGQWGLVLKDSTAIGGYESVLRRHGIEVRTQNVREVGNGHPRYEVWDRGDLYARAPKEAE